MENLQKSFLSRISMLINYTMWYSNLFLHPAVSRVFRSSGFSESRFFRVQVFQGSGFSDSGSRVRVQVLSPGLEVAVFKGSLCFSFEVDKFVVTHVCMWSEFFYRRLNKLLFLNLSRGSTFLVNWSTLEISLCLKYSIFQKCNKISISNLEMYNIS